MARRSAQAPRTLTELIESVTSVEGAYFSNGHCHIIVYVHSSTQYVETSGEGDVQPTVHQDREELYKSLGDLTEVPCWKLRQLDAEDKVVA